jgi:hypothetical protein
MRRRIAQIRPQDSYGKAALTLRVRLTVKDLPDGAQVKVADLLLQAGSTATGWVPHVTEMPWTAGIVGG